MLNSKPWKPKKGKPNTRRKVIAGALALEHFEKNRDSEFGRIMFRLLDEYVVRPHDRALFPDLPAPEVHDGHDDSGETGTDLVPDGPEIRSSPTSP
jgi:hypothetical protein